MVVHSRIRLADCGPFKSRFSADFMSASRPKPDIQLELLERSAVDPKRNSQLLRHLFYGMSLVYAYGAKQQIAATGEK